MKNSLKILSGVLLLFSLTVFLTACGGGGGDSNNGGGSGGEVAENFTLTVNKFGKGVVISDVSGIDCGNDCSEIYPSGTTVTLTAQELVAASAAENGYSFKSWAGCDSVDGTTCTVTMDGDQVVLPTFGRKVVLQGETKILDENAMQYLINRESSIFYFDPGIESVVVLQVGDVIMGRVIGGNGFLRKITNIYTAAGKLVVETEFATIPDAVAQGTLSFSKKLTHSDLAISGTIINSGVSLQRAESPDSTVFTFNVNTQVAQNGIRPAWEVNESFGIVNIQGAVSLTFEIDTALDKCWCWPPIEGFRTVLIVTQDNDLDISASEGAKVEGSISLGSLTFPVSLSGLPATLEVEIFLGVNGEIEVTASTGAILTNKITAGVRYRKDEGWSPVSGYSRRSFTVKPVELGGSVSLTGYVKPEASLLIVGLVGPYMNLESYLKLQGEASSTALAWGLYYGLDSHAGVKSVKIFGVDMPLYSDVDLLDPNPEWELDSGIMTIGNTPPTATITSPSDGDSYSQGQSITFSGSGYDAEDGPLSSGSLVWTSSIDGQIGTGTSFTKSDLSVGTHTITLVATDSKGKSGNASINITLTAATSLTITATSLPSGTVGVSYPATNISATGGEKPYRWSILNGSRPPGLSMSTAGIISGTPTTAGTYSFTVQVKDSSSPQQTASKALSIKVLLVPNQDPIISSITVNPLFLNTGETATVTCNASDPDNDPLAYSWTKTGGSISGTGSTVTWTAPPTTGTYTVTCNVSDGKGGTASKGVNISVSLSVTPPAAPSSLSATALSQSVIALVWQDNSGNESGFKIERKTGTTGTYSQITTVSAISGSGSGGYYEDSGLAASTTYCYRIQGYNSAGNSGYSNESCATTNAPPCVTPTATTGSATNITSNAAILNGTVNSNGVATGAFFQYGTSTSYGYTTPSQVLGSGTSNVNVSANLTGLLPNTTYHFRIIATNGCGGTVYGSDQSLTTRKEVTVANTGGMGLNLRSGSGLGYSIIAGLPEGTKMSVIGGPVQADGYTWWNITGSYGTGWGARGDWLTPEPQIGITVTVTYTGGYGLRLRSCADLSCSVITTLPDGTQMNVFDGPVQADGYTWWNITGSYGTGWSAVGNWLVPNPRY